MNAIQKLMDLSAEVEAAKAEADALAAEVKKMHNEVYAPLCARKAEAARRHEALAEELQLLIAKNKTLFEAIKRIGK